MIFPLWVIFIALSCKPDVEGSWQKAVDENSIIGYEVFLKKHPSSPYQETAFKKIDFLKWSQDFQIEEEKILIGKITILMKDGGYDANGNKIFQSGIYYQGDSASYRLYITPGTQTSGIDTTTISENESQRIPGNVPVSILPYFTHFPVAFKGKYKMEGYVLKPKTKWDEEKYLPIADSLNKVIDNYTNNRQNPPDSVLLALDKLITIGKLNYFKEGLGSDKFFIVRKVEYLK